MAAKVRDAKRLGAARVQAHLLGPFSLTAGDRTAGPWARPPAKRLCQLLLVSPERCVVRTAAREALFPTLGQPEAILALSKALSMARTALSALGEPGRQLLQADRTLIWVGPTPIDVDWQLHRDMLQMALAVAPGLERDDQLAAALADGGTLLEDEQEAEWALRPRERLDWLRQEARLALARDRTRGEGRSHPDAVVTAWEECLAHDATSEEAATALMRVYQAQGRHALERSTYHRCRDALEALGLRVSPALQQVHAVSGGSPDRAQDVSAGLLVPVPARHRDERRLVSVLFADLASPGGARFEPEDLRERVGAALAAVVAQVEALDGTVTSVSGAGLVALFGAPVAHEDDPERALRAAFRVMSGLAGGPDALSLRVGIETGEAVVGGLLGHGGAHYGAVGEVVTDAAVLQSVAKRGSVLVGPATYAASEGSFEWGPTEEVPTSPGSKPLVGFYLERPKARPSGSSGRRGLAGAVPLAGRVAELELFGEVLRQVTAGRGGVVLVTGEPGLGKTRLVSECRKLFMAWVGAVSGRLPLWLEGRAASYAASNPYGLYQQLLAAWVGVAPEGQAEVMSSALDRVLKLVFAGEPGRDRAWLLSRLMGLATSPPEPALAQLSPEQLQRATFAAVSDVLSRLVGHGPTVLVLEDLHWADPTSLRLTEELAAVTHQGPLLLVLTRRPEPDAGVAALEATFRAEPGLRLWAFELSPLSDDTERELARSFLGQRAADEVVDAVSRGADGNPLFLEQRLSSLLETGALTNNEEGWRLDGALSWALPEALERLVRARVDRLRPGPHDALIAAAVLGPEFGLEALRGVTEAEEDLDDILSELCTAGLLTELRQSGETTYRFRHALIQEAAYKGLVKEERRRLHGRAAWSLERLAQGRLDEIAGVLGHHFAMADETGRAAHYLDLAGDRAVSIFANDEAVASYRYALDVVQRGGPQSSQQANVGPAATLSTAVRAKLGEVLLRTGRFGEARQAINQGLRLNPDNRNLDADMRFGAARLWGLLGRVEIADHDYEAATSALAAAAALLGDHLEDEDQATVDLRLDVQLDGLAYVHYWRNEPEKAAPILAAARPVIEARATPARKESFFRHLALSRARQTRYQIDEEILSNITTAATVARAELPEGDVGLCVFALGFCLLWHGDLEEAREQFEAALAIAERTGDVVLRARCLCYLNVAALCRHDVDGVRKLVPLALASAQEASYPEYVAAATAAGAWLAWREDRHEDVLALAAEALEMWATTVVSYSWYWIGLWPLIAVRLARREVGEAVEAGRQLLPAPQQRLPDELAALVERAIAAWDGGDAEGAAAKMQESLSVAQRLRYA